MTIVPQERLELSRPKRTSDLKSEVSTIPPLRQPPNYLLSGTTKRLQISMIAAPAITIAELIAVA